MSMTTPSASASDSESRGLEKPAAVVLWDRQHCIPLGRVLSDDDVILLLTPVVVPPDPQIRTAADPFEPLGKALSGQHRAVRHVPYTKSHGITGVHVAFINRVKVVIFVITGFSNMDGVSQPDFAGIVADACDTRPFVLVACCDIPADYIHALDFPTVLQTKGFSRLHLAEVSSLLLDGAGTTPDLGTESTDLPRTRTVWPVHQWDHDRDAPEAFKLWRTTMPREFHLEESLFLSLLRRDGYAMHHVVREPESGAMLGFCATYTTFAGSSGDTLIGSIAALIVREDYQNRGIGRSLHAEALSKISRIRGVARVQLGSTFPRLLYGLPATSPEVEWFQGRGWELTESGRGRGFLAADWILRFEDMPSLNLASAGLSFRQCQMPDFQDVIDMVSRESSKKLLLGWYDQYAKVLDSSFLGDIIVGFEGTTLAAAAITYIPGSDNPVAADLPWAGTIGSNVGGVTCICIIGKFAIVQP